MTPGSALQPCHQGARAALIHALCRLLPAPLGWRLARGLSWWLEALGVSEQPWPAPAARIAADQILHLWFELPVAALGALDDHIADAIARRTPFQPEAVVGGYRLSPAGKSRVRCDILLAARDRSPDPAGGLSLHAETLTLDLAPAVRPAGRRWLLPVLLLIAVVAALLAPSARLSAMRDHGAAALAAVERDAAVARGLADRLASLRAARAEAARFRAEKPGVSESLGKLSTALPTTAWLEDLKLGGGEATLHGRGRSAAEVLPALDRSIPGSEPRLSAPVSVDPQGFELFTITLSIGGDRHAAD